MIFALVGGAQILAAARLAPDHWLVRAQRQGGPLNLLSRRGGLPPPGRGDPNRGVRRSGTVFVALGAAMALVGLVGALL